MGEAVWVFALLYSNCPSAARETHPIFENVSLGFDTVEQGALPVSQKWPDPTT